ncbi:MAG: response regulator [Catonella sp.]|nr:response regulator [Catonella sp.]
MASFKRYSFCEYDPDKIHMIFKVADTGQGIKEEDIGKLFGSFSQVDTKRNRKKEGTGLGLAISKSLVERMGGHIGVESVYGKGSTFTFDIYQHRASEKYAAEIREENKGQTVSGIFASPYLNDALVALCREYGLSYIDFKEALKGEIPEVIFCDSAMHDEYSEFLENEANKGKMRHILIKNPMTEESDAKEFSLNKPLYTLNFCQVINHDTVTTFETHAETIDFIAPDAKILIVDDNEMNLKVAKGLLAPLKMNIDTAGSGKEALGKITDDRYDIIFMDHMMPEMDGIECTEKIRVRESAYMKNVPIIALTANAVAGAKEEFLAAGMNDFVPKPIEMNNICKKIKTYLPKEKVKKQKVELNADYDEAADFPELAGIDIKEGIKNSGSAEMFKGFLGDYYRLIDMKAAKIRDCLKSELARFAADDDGDKREASKDEIIDLLNKIKSTADDFDLDGTDAALKELTGVKLPESLSAHLTKLQALVADVASDDIITEAEEMIGIAEAEIQ